MQGGRPGTQQYGVSQAQPYQQQSYPQQPGMGMVPQAAVGQQPQYGGASGQQQWGQQLPMQHAQGMNGGQRMVPNNSSGYPMQQQQQPGMPGSAPGRAAGMPQQPMQAPQLQPPQLGMQQPGLAPGGGMPGQGEGGGGQQITAQQISEVRVPHSTQYIWYNIQHGDSHINYQHMMYMCLAVLILDLCLHSSHPVLTETWPGTDGVDDQTLTCMLRVSCRMAMRWLGLKRSRGFTTPGT